MKLLDLLRKKTETSTMIAHTAYWELAERLSREPTDREPSVAEVTKVESVLRDAGRSPAQLARDVLDLRQLHQLEASAGDPSALRAAAKAAAVALASLDAERAKWLSEWDERRKAAEAARSRAEAAAAACARSHQELAALRDRIDKRRDPQRVGSREDLRDQVRTGEQLTAELQLRLRDQRLRAQTIPMSLEGVAEQERAGGPPPKRAQDLAAYRTAQAAAVSQVEQELRDAEDELLAARATLARLDGETTPAPTAKPPRTMGSGSDDGGRGPKVTIIHDDGDGE